MPQSAWIDEQQAAAASGGLHAVSGMPQRRGKFGRQACGRADAIKLAQYAGSAIPELHFVPRADSWVECRCYTSCGEKRHWATN